MNHDEEELDAFLSRYAESEKWKERLEDCTPGGAATMSKRPAAFGTTAYPGIITRGDGGRVWDADGNEYVDLICGLASIGVGYAEPSINAAVHAQIERGVSFSLPTMLECEVAERLIDTIPCADMVRFVKTGSEACHAAVHIARKATGKDGVLVCGYHGWHNWYTATKADHQGIPETMGTLVRAFLYNDMDDLRLQYYALSNHHNQGVAALIMEPTLMEKPTDGYLDAVRDFCTEKGIVLIFDEMVTGFRWATAGAQEYFEVEPDLATYGKAMANGYAMACVVGKRELMEHGTVVSGTFGGEAVGLAAALATMNLYDEEPIVDALWAAGRAIWREFELAFLGAGLPAKLTGWPLHPRADFLLDDADMNRKCAALFTQEMAAEGVLIHPAGWNVCARHNNERDIVKVRNASEVAAHRVRTALDLDNLDEALIGGAAPGGVRA